MALFAVALAVLVAGPLLGIKYSHMSHERDKEEIAREADRIRREGRPN